MILRHSHLIALLSSEVQLPSEGASDSNPAQLSLMSKPALLDNNTENKSLR